MGTVGLRGRETDEQGAEEEKQRSAHSEGRNTSSHHGWSFEKLPQDRALRVLRLLDRSAEHMAMGCRSQRRSCWLLVTLQWW